MTLTDRQKDRVVPAKMARYTEDPHTLAKKVNKLVRPFKKTQDPTSGIQRYTIKTKRQAEIASPRVDQARLTELDLLHRSIRELLCTKNNKRNGKGGFLGPAPHETRHGELDSVDPVIHRSRCVRATSVNHNIANNNKNNCYLLSAIMDSQVEEYDPEFPQGRPQKPNPVSHPTSKMPFTGYFDPDSQSYVIDHFDEKIMQADKATSSNILVKAAMPPPPTPTAPQVGREQCRKDEIKIISIRPTTTQVA